LNWIASRLQRSQRRYHFVITKPDKAAVIQSGGNGGTGFFLSAVAAMTRKEIFCLTRNPATSSHPKPITITYQTPLFSTLEQQHQYF